jgi:hypothetical protein
MLEEKCFKLLCEEVDLKKKYTKKVQRIRSKYNKKVTFKEFIKTCSMEFNQNFEKFYNQISCEIILM